MLSFINVSKRYPGGHEALNSVNLHIAPGEMVFLTGHSGAGKSTMLKLITRLEVASHGQIMVEGRNVGRMSDREIPRHRRRLGVIFQDNRLLPDRTVFDNVALPLVIAGCYRHVERRRLVHAVLDKVGLLKRERDFPLTLSGGEQQRVGIARAVVNKPSVLLADEPTGNLDPDLSLEIMELFAGFQQVGVTVLVASHDLDLLSRFSCRRVRLAQGRLVSDLASDDAPCEP